jgi:hypothetical protein
MEFKKINQINLKLPLFFASIFILSTLLSKIFVIPILVFNNYSEGYTELIVSCEQGKFFNNSLSNLNDSLNINIDRNIQNTLNDCLKAEFFKSNMKNYRVTEQRLSHLTITSLQDSRIPTLQKINSFSETE